MTAEDTRLAWENQRPILDRLPYYGYQDNPAARALTAWADSFLSDRKAQLENFYLQLHPDTCDNASLDYLAYLCGFSGDFWDINWSEETKRDFIRDSYAYLWQYRGTTQAIRKVLDILRIQYRLWQQNELTLPFVLSSQLGGSGLRLYIRLPLTYSRTSYGWKESARTLRNWAPACTETRVTYEYFYLGFSHIGDPLYFGDRTLFASLPRSGTVTYGSPLTLQLPPAGSPEIIFYDPVPDPGNVGSFSLSGSGNLTYTPSAIWGTRLEDILTYRVWSRQATAEVRTFRALLDPSLLYYQTFATHLVAEVDRAGTTTQVGTIHNAGLGQLRQQTNNTQGSYFVALNSADLDISAMCWIVAGDTTQFYQIRTRVIGSSLYAFRITQLGAFLLYNPGTGFVTRASFTFPTPLAGGFREFRVRIVGSSYEVYALGDLVLSGSDLTENLTSTQTAIQFNSATASNCRVDLFSIRNRSAL